jgi:hypothetical protein
MPVKRRKSKMKALQLTPEAFAAFDTGDKNALRRALKLPQARLCCDEAGQQKINDPLCASTRDRLLPVHSDKRTQRCATHFLWP